MTTTSSVSAPTSQISGLISGLDTQSIITQLMTLEAQPQTNLKNAVTTEQTQVSAYQGIASQITAMGTIADSLRTAGAWQLTKGTSSDSSVTVSSTTGATLGDLSFDVTSIAAGQTSISSATYAGLSATVAAGPLTITGSKGTTTITPSDGSLSSVVSAINDTSAATGVKAVAVQVGAGTYRLQLTSTTSGAASAFSVGGLTDSQSTVTAASDAVLTVGAGGPNPYTITSATNVISGVLPGVTLTVTKPTTGVAVSVRSDPGALAQNVQKMVDAANAIIGSIKANTAYDPTSKTGGPLLGDATVREIQQSLLSAVSGAVAGQSLTSAGVSVQKDGTLSFDATAFTNLLTSDPTTAQGLFASSASWAGSSATNGTVIFLNAGARTPEGDHAFSVTQAATRSSATIGGAITAGQVITLGEGTQSTTYTTTGTETADELATNLTAAAAAANISVGFTNAGGTLQVTSMGYGTASGFTLSATGGLSASAVTQGLDVAGTIDGVAAVGNGQVLSASVSGPNNGLSVRVTMSPDDVAAGAVGGTLSYHQGLAQRLSTIVSQATDPADGTLTTLVTGHNSDITDMKTRIATWDSTLSSRKDSLEKQYAALEVALGKLKDQSTWLAGQIASLPSSSSSS